MLVSSVVHCIAVLIFQLWGVQTHSPIPACPASCVCEKTLLVNCASLGLSKAPSHIPATATALDLSHNALHSLAPLGSGHMHLRGLQHLWLGNNSLESLSMCSGIQGILSTRSLTRRKQRCVSWAPDLQSLSADRNQLKRLPRGLGNIQALKVLQLSHNRISEIGPADLAGCTHLSELHLQHNLINTIHPEAFKDLQKLKVLDLSYNLLATIPVPAYLSLRNLKVLVDISGNRWRCDCNLKTFRRWLSFDRELGNPAWEVVCFSPPHYAGKDLLYLEESDLACPQPVYNTPGVKKEVTVDEGMELILSCSTGNQGTNSVVSLEFGYIEII
ncbi:beta-sarcoglycan isoform X1 [Ictalurus furcatus]|uniref:beta-sarcoglycan isoform X1 n=1 Tax=Ictalurus furcatus TaxID=66913 RepID=UPI0023501578|nr:beta-sarcoglycan isoform X1 [Ictalurus furcatus]